VITMDSSGNFSKYFLEKLGEKFWIATLIPSLALVIAALITFDPILRISSSSVVISGTLTEKIVMAAVLVIIPSLMLGFLLYVAQSYIVRSSSGFGFFQQFAFMRNLEIRKANNLLSQVKSLQEEIFKLKKNKRQDNKTRNRIETLRDRYYTVAAQYDQSFPREFDDILPTRLGNILTAAEDYPRTRYGMNATVFWPRLRNLLPQETKQAIESSLNELYVLLNFSFLSVILYIWCIIAVLYSGAALQSVHVGLSRELVFRSLVESTFRYIFAGSIALFVSWFFYRLALFSASEFGAQMRSAFDLHRFLLLQEMRIELPSDSLSEYDLWVNLGEFMVLGELSVDFLPFHYANPQKRKETTAEVPAGRKVPKKRPDSRKQT